MKLTIEQLMTRSLLTGFALCSLMGLLFTFVIDIFEARITAGYAIFGIGIMLYVYLEIAIKLGKVKSKEA